jgi:hypothetical protein
VPCPAQVLVLWALCLPVVVVLQGAPKGDAALVGRHGRNGEHLHRPGSGCVGWSAAYRQGNSASVGSARRGSVSGAPWGYAVLCGAGEGIASF